MEPAYLSVFDKHGYPVDWFKRGITNDALLALDWVLDVFPLGTNYYQDWWNGVGADLDREFVLVDVDGGVHVAYRKPLGVDNFLIQGMVSNFSLLGKDGWCFSTGTNSPAVWHGTFSKSPNDISLELMYQFLRLSSNLVELGGLD